MKNIFTLFFTLLLALTINLSAQLVKLNGNEAGMTVNVLHSSFESTTVEFSFDGYNQHDININGKSCISLDVPGMVWLMGKGLPQLPISRKSIVISDRGGINYRVISREIVERTTGTIMPSKGHILRDKDPNSIPYTFDKFYNSNKWYPENTVEIGEPYIIRDLRGVTVQFNPMQYNSSKQILRICTKLRIEIFHSTGKSEVNPLVRQYPLVKVASEFAPIYRDLFINYG
jgi:hypothetical protein